MNVAQILSITCDNVSNNDTMVTELDIEMDDFSKVNWIWCFLHVVNLIAKSLLKQFDVTKGCGEGTDAANEELETLLAELAMDFEYEESVTQELDNANEEEFDDIEEVPDVLTEEERAELATDIRIVTLMLGKVSAVEYSECRLMKGNSASKACLKGDQLNHHPLASMEQCHQGVEDDTVHHALRCPNVIEFNI